MFSIFKNGKKKKKKILTTATSTTVSEIELLMSMKFYQLKRESIRLIKIYTESETHQMLPNQKFDDTEEDSKIKILIKSFNRFYFKNEKHSIFKR